MAYMQRLTLTAVLTASAALAQLSLSAQESTNGEAPAVFRDPAIQGAYDNGVKLLSEDKPKEAMMEFNKALQADPTFAAAYIGKGDALQAMEDYQSAEVAYSRAIEIDQNSAAAYNGRGEAALELQKVDGAAADFARAIELDPSNPSTLSNLGHIMINYARDPQGAIRRLNDALAQNDKDARAYRDRGYAHALLQDFKAAEADLKKASEVDPDDHENFFIMANVYLFQNNFQAAIDALTHSIDAYKPKGPTDPKKFLNGYLSRADAWMRIGQEEKDQKKSEAAFRNVIADANAVIDDNPDRFPEAGRAQYRKGRAQRMLQEYADAVDTLTLALEAIPQGQEAEYVADAHMYRGICWYYIGSHDLARGDFETASSVGGGFGDPRVYMWIGLTHHKEGDYRDAIEAYSEAIAKSPKFAMAHTNKGRAYMDLKEYKKAIESFYSAILAEPSVGEHYYNVGAACVELEDWPKAEHFLNIALRKQNPRPEMYRLMATVLRERGKEDLAEEYERKAESAPAQAASK